MSQAWSHPRCASSSRIRISSGTAMVGCVSFSWIATFSGSVLQSVLRRRNRRTRSASEQATRKYSCTKRSACPMLRRVVGIEHARERFGGERSGQRADEIAAAELLEIEIVRRGGRPQAQRVDRLAAVADHRPIKGDADQRRGTSRRRAASFRRRSSNEQLSLTSTVSFGRGDLPRVLAAQPVVRLFVLPAVHDRCLNMPYS